MGDPLLAAGIVAAVVFSMVAGGAVMIYNFLTGTPM